MCAGQAGSWRDVPCTPVPFLDPVSGETLIAWARGQEVALAVLASEAAFSRCLGSSGVPKLAWETSLPLALI